MKLFLIKFTLDKHPKQEKVGGSSIKDCISKLENRYRNARKPPVVTGFEIIEEYGENKPIFTIDGMEECDNLRAKLNL